jgi:hypothetical protein
MNGSAGSICLPALRAASIANRASAAPMPLFWSSAGTSVRASMVVPSWWRYSVYPTSSPSTRAS